MKARRTDELPISARQLMRAMRESVLFTDLHGTILEVNRAFSAVTGHPRREVLGKNPRMLQSGRQSRPFYEAMWRALRRKGHWSGEIWNKRKNGEIYPEWLSIGAIKDARGRPAYYLGVFSDITRRKLSEERLARLGRYDALTALPNRRMFTERLRDSVRERGPGRLAVLFLDIDRFKEVNDRFGHTVGDHLLKAVGARLKSCIRRTDIAGRLAGDEFVVLLDPVSRREDAVRIARKILRVMRQPFIIGGSRIKATASVGACLSSGKATPARLVKRADGAMYKAKGRGGDAFTLTQMT